MTTDRDIIDLAAQAMYTQDAQDSMSSASWQDLAEGERDDWRRIAEAGIAALRDAGLLVTSRYYVPSPKELYDVYARISKDLIRSGASARWRWVMCRETWDALHKRERERRVFLLRELRFTWKEMTGGTLPEVADDPLDDSAPVVHVDYSAQKARLFGIDVRIDPAARSPLIEIDTDATMRANTDSWTTEGDIRGR